MSVSCGSVSFGTTHHRGPGLHGGLYLQDTEDIDPVHVHQHAGYRSLPHKSQRAYPGGPSPINYPYYSSTVSTPRTRPSSQQQSLGGPHPQQPLPTSMGSNKAVDSSRGSLLSSLETANNTTSVASDNRSESTVIEQRRASNSRSIISLQSGTFGGPEETSFLVVQGVGGPVAHIVDVDQDAGHCSSEDNLSHDSYELIEKVGHSSIIDLQQKPQITTSGPTIAGSIPIVTSANQFEQEFYRQAAQANQKNNGLGSSRASSHCSLTMSPQVMKRPNAVTAPVTSETPESQNPAPAGSLNTASLNVPNDMSRVKSQDSFSQASNHNLSLTNLNNNSSDIEGTPPVLSRNQTVMDDNIETGSVRSDLMVIKEEPRIMVDIVRGTTNRGRGSGNYSHSLPRSNADFMYHHQQQQQQQPHPHHPQQQQQQNYTRTLPNRRRERSPVYYSRSRIAQPMGGVPPEMCSSGSSSSHASPQIARPKSLEFAVVNVNALPNKQAFAYHDDSLELQHYHPQPKPRHLLTKPQPIGSQDPYDDSSSAVNEQLSSSDVPQTPENPDITFLPPEAGPVLIGCHQGIVRKQYYTTEERIYDVPEGIEGVSEPIKIITSQPPQVEPVTSPSSSSGITDSYVPKLVSSGGILGASGTPIGHTPAPKGAPPPPPHQPVIAQHITRNNHRGLASTMASKTSKLPKVDIDPRKFQSLMNTLGPQDSTESADSSCLQQGPNKLLQRPAVRPNRGRGTVQSHYSTTTLPPPQRALLATMSSTESESAMSARSAPTPISNPEQLMRPKKGELFIEPEILFEESGPEQPESPKLQVNLISPPAEDQSESSTAVLDSEGVPAPPPEFSGAAMVSDDDHEQATDVEEDSQSHLAELKETTANNTAKNSMSSTGIPNQETTNPILVIDSISDVDVTSPKEVDIPEYVAQEVWHKETEESSTNKETDSLQEKPIKGIMKPQVVEIKIYEDYDSNQDLPDIVQEATVELGEAENEVEIVSSMKEEENEIPDPRILVIDDDELPIEQGEEEEEEEEEEDEEASSKVIKIADLYVKLEHNGSGSTISDEGNTGSDVAPVPFIDDISDDPDQLPGPLLAPVVEAEVVALPVQQHAEAFFIPPTPTNLSKSEDEPPPSKEAIPQAIDQCLKEEEETSDQISSKETFLADQQPPDETTLDQFPPLENIQSSSLDLDMDNIPPPLTHCDLRPQPSNESTSSTYSPPPPPPIMQMDSTDAPPTAFFTASNEGESGSNDNAGPPSSFPFPPRALSRISEGSTSTTRPEDQPICSRSGSEGGPDTMTDQNCTTSEDGDINPPSLNSDIPENNGRTSEGGAVMRAIAMFEDRVQFGDSKDLPSPPSSMVNTMTEEVTQEGKTEVTMVDSLYLELTPGPPGEEGNEVVPAEEAEREIDFAGADPTEDDIDVEEDEGLCDQNCDIKY